MKWTSLVFISLITLDTWAAKVLQIGNSHTVGSFGTSLYKALSGNVNVTAARSIGLASASGIQYASDLPKNRTLSYGYIDRPRMKTEVSKGTVDKLSTLLDNEKPDMLVVELGDNFAGYRENAKGDQGAKIQIDHILKQIKLSHQKPSECFWVGPNWTDWVDNNDLPLDRRKNPKATFYKKTNARAREIAKTIKKAIEGQCTYVDSMKIMEKSEVKTADGLHCNQASGTLWGQRAYEEIASKSSLLSVHTRPTAVPDSTNNGR